MAHPRKQGQCYMSAAVGCGKCTGRHGCRQGEGSGGLRLGHAPAGIYPSLAASRSIRRATPWPPACSAGSRRRAAAHTRPPRSATHTPYLWAHHQTPHSRTRPSTAGQGRRGRPGAAVRQRGAGGGRGRRRQRHVPPRHPRGRQQQERQQGGARHEGRGGRARPVAGSRTGRWCLVVCGLCGPGTCCLPPRAGRAAAT